MSEASIELQSARWQRLPQWLRPRIVERRGRGELRLIETTVLVLVGVLLAVATVDDVARQVHINHRLVVDLRTWRSYTRHDYHNISIDQQTLGIDTQREVLCGNTSPGPPDARTQICLAIWGPVAHGVRSVHGGWYIAPYVQDLPANRYGCFGPAGAGRCPR